ncbi:ABC transporter permease [Cesiribacter andamanensis]|uniref:Macrolide export ATP-binding/permease protein MacB n=1 Tax=Cesiribacter andamanensis AMV16 TaxID=1279009 RepID=M7N687_9BACT|nr:ABC transporter permease [Cesiribacter andamanensis]EMR02751.1 Macrolide export ATP-binding/permease protein MacB [Cesiribacter andamanensis AMV16]
MIRNYLKIALRNLLKYKFISFINLFGLTVGLSCCLLILGYILHELSYDRYHRKANNIYRVERTFINPESGLPSLVLGTVAPPVGPLLENDFEEIRKLTRLLPTGLMTLRYKDKLFNEQNIYCADEHFFDVFDVEVVQGHAPTALSNPFSLMLSEEMARKYFGDEDPLGKEVQLSSQFACKVTGVYKSFPSNSHLHPEILLSFNTLKSPEIYGEEALRTNWGNNSFFTYVLLPEGYDPGRLEAQFPAFLNRHIQDDGGGTLKPSDWSRLTLTPLTDIHLYSHTDLEAEENGDIRRVYIFSAIGLFILLIACINYMNLATARSVLRAKEIGVRKVVGAGKGELVLQFLCEAVLISWLATLLAFGLCWLAFPWLNQLSGQALSIDILLRWEVLLPLLLVPFVVGILSGIYPALFLSSFKPIKVLKGVSGIGGSSISFRQVLVVVQFSISIILIISTLVVYQQLQYLQNKALGFDREHVITFNNNQVLAPAWEAFRTELLSSVHVKEAGRSSRIPTGRLLDAMGSQISRGDSLSPTKADIKYIVADDHFFSVYGIQLAAGRFFSREFGADTTSFIINEAAASVLGLPDPQQAIGMGFQYGDRRGQLVGVVQDFHFESMHQRILPMVFFKSLSQNGGGQISVKIAGENIAAALTHIEQSWHRFAPDFPFEYTFLDETYARLYQAEQQQGSIFTLFACIAIAIASLGLFGLSAFTISQRVKEIGIRKVLGAETSTIVGLLSKDFMKLVGIAALIAFPLAWYFMNRWLEDFAYRIDVPLWVFAAAGLAAALVAFFTISFQAIKAATANPVKNLRTE